MPTAAEIQKGLQKDAITQIANVSAQLREAVAASIPGITKELHLNWSTPYCSQSQSNERFQRSQQKLIAEHGTPRGFLFSLPARPQRFAMAYQEVIVSLLW